MIFRSGTCAGAFPSGCPLTLWLTGCEEQVSSVWHNREERGRLPAEICVFRAIRRFFCVAAPQIRAEIRECVCFFAATRKITRYSRCTACMARPASRFILMISTFTRAVGGAVVTGARSAPAGKTLSHTGDANSRFAGAAPKRRARPVRPCERPVGHSVHKSAGIGFRRQSPRSLSKNWNRSLANKSRVPAQTTWCPQSRLDAFGHLSLPDWAWRSVQPPRPWVCRQLQRVVGEQMPTFGV